MRNLLTNPHLTRLSRNPTASMFVASEVGYILPREVLTFMRSRTEFKETFPYDAANTIGYYGGGFLASHMAKQVFKTSTPKDKHQLFWEHVAESGFVYSVLGGIMGAVPPLKNWMSAKFLHQTQFSTGVLADSDEDNPADTPTQREIKRAKRKYRHRAQAIGVGAALAGTGFLAAGKAATVGRLEMPDWLDRARPFLEAHVLLGANEKGQSSFMKMPVFPMFGLYGAACFVSSIWNSRDKIEAREWENKFAVFTASLFVLPKLIKHAGGVLAQHIMKDELTPEIKQNAVLLTELASQVSLMSLSTWLIQRITKYQMNHEKHDEPVERPAPLK